MDFEFTDSHALNEVAKLRYMVATGDGVIPGSEVDKLRQRHIESGVINFSCTPAPEFRGTAEDLALDLNEVNDWLSDPVNNVLSRIGGQLMLLEDYVHCTETRIDFKDGWPGTPVEPTKQEKAKIKEYKSTIRMLRDCEALIKDLQTENQQLRKQING